MEVAGNLKVAKSKKGKGKEKTKCKQFTQQSATLSPVISQVESVSSMSDDDSIQSKNKSLYLETFVNNGSESSNEEIILLSTKGAKKTDKLLNFYTGIYFT